MNNRKKGKLKYGIELPRSYAHAVRLDSQNENRLWQDAVEKEMAALIHHKCFEFKEPNYKPTADYQYAPLNLIFEVKVDLTRKARLVIMGNVVDPRGLATRATVVKGISVRSFPLLPIVTVLLSFVEISVMPSYRPTQRRKFMLVVVLNLVIEMVVLL